MSTWVTAAVAVAAALAGLAAGAWVIPLTAWLPLTEPGLRPPPARCPRCEARLDPAWWRLHRRCPEVAALGAWGPAEAVTTAGVLAVMALRFGPVPVLPAFCFLGVVGTPLAFIDARHKRLPDALTLPAYPVALVLLGVAALAGAGLRPFLTALIGMGAAWLLFLIQGLVYPAGIGWGDVKLSGLLGLYLGWTGIRALVAGLFLGYLLAALTGVALLAARRATGRTQIPFGPFLLAGALIAIAASGGPLR